MTAATSHNGGRTTTNFSDLAFGGEWPFLNLLKAQDRLGVYGGPGNVPVEPSSLDDNGYPTSVTQLGVIARVYIPTQQERPGRYVLDWTGNGSILIGSSITYYTGYSSADLTSSSGSGYVEFTPTDNTLFLNIGIGTVGSPYISEYRLYHINDAAAIGPIGSPVGIFGTQFLARLRESNMGRLRFLSWPDYNKTNLTTWRTRTPVNHITYGIWRTLAAGYCNPASNSLSGKTYSFAAPSQDLSTGSAFALADKACVHVKFTSISVMPNLSATITNATDSILVTAHNLSVGQQVFAASVSGPTNITNGALYYVVAVPDANHIKVDTQSFLTGIVPNASGTCVFQPTIRTLVGTQNATDTITITAHGLSVNDQVWVDDTTFGNQLAPMFVTAVPTANSIKLSLTLGGAAITATGTGSVNVSPCILANIGATGAKVIRSSYGLGISSGGNAYPVVDGRSIATLMYDAKLDSWIKQGGDVADGGCGILGGVPPELMVALCAEVGAHPHFVMPRFALDPMTDWVSSLATYCRDNGPSWMKPAFEGPNECWNTFGGFYNASYANAKSYYHWGTADYDQWYGKVISTMGQDLYTVFSSNTAKFDLLCGVHTGLGNTYPGGTAGSDNRLDSGAYVAQAAAAQSGYIKAAAKNYATTVAVANYFSPSDYGQSAETTASASFAACDFFGTVSGTTLTTSSVAFGTLTNGMVIFGGDGIGGTGVTISSVSGSSPTYTCTLNTSLSIPIASRMIAGNFSGNVVGAYVDTVNSGTGNFTLAKDLILFTNWKSWASSKGVNKLCCYEGGYSPDLTGTALDTTTPLDQFRAAGQMNSGLQTYTTTMMNNFVGLTGGGFTAEYPSSYFGGNSPTTNIWQIIDDVYTTKYMASFEAIKAFNQVAQYFINLRLRLHS